MKHKILPAILAIALLLLLAACASAPALESAPPEEASSPSETTSAPPEEAPPSEEAPALSEETSAASGYPVTITNYNYAGEEITLTFDKAPERVLAVYQGCIETMIALGLEEHVAASYGLDNEVKPDWKDGFSRMNYNDSTFAPDKETVVMLEPDMIFSWGSIFAEKNLGDVDYWMERGVSTYMNTNTRPGGDRILENEYADILNIGKIFNVQDRAEALVNQMKADVETVKAAVLAEPVTPSIAIIGFYDSGIRNYGLELAGDIADHLGVEVMLSPESYIGKEDLVKENPDIIFVEYMPRPESGGDAVKDEELAKLLEDPAFSSLYAVQNSRVYPIMLGDIYAPAVRTGDGIRTLANGIFPDLLG
ncbi:MAG: ABC transporter substrate-binding protein [Clostridiales bacterium]|jgi:iron complex transport system substrate-binding protein|nr:ABC transporter substrate-binding protein [Clostridiales bacterium]